MMNDENKVFYSNFGRVNLAQFTPIIKQYWEEFDNVLSEYNNPLMGFSVPVHQKETVELIKKLKKLPTWKSNLFILYLHYKKTSVLAEILKVNKNSLSVYLCEIKKEIKNITL